MRVTFLLQMVIGAGFAVAVVTPFSIGRAGELEANYFRGLRERRLFDLAENYCLHRLSDQKSSLAERAGLTLELAQTYAEHAPWVAESEQTELWRRAAAVVQEFLSANPAPPRRLELNTQLALIAANEGQCRRWQAELQTFDATRAAAARAALQAAMTRLRDLEPQVVQALSKRRAYDQLRAQRRQKGLELTDDLPPELKSSELQRLLSNVRLRWAAALADFAQMHERGSPDRSAALQEAEKLLRPISENAESESLAWDARVLLVACARLLGDDRRTLQILDALLKLEPSATDTDRLQAERIRLALDRKKPQDALRELAVAAQARPALPAELAFLRVLALGQAWQLTQSAHDAPAAAALLGEMEQRVAQIRDEVGGYWGYRAALALEEVQAIAQWGPELAPLVRRAQAEYGRGDKDAAIKSFDQAAAVAAQAKRNDQAFELGFMRASIQVEAEHWAEAAESCQQLVEKHPEHSQAADASFLAAFALGKLYSQKQTKTRRLAYANALEQHRAHYPQHATAAEATWFLAQLEEYRQQFSAALELYEQVPADHARGLAAQAATARCYEKIIHRLRELGEPTDAWEKDALDRLQAMLPPAATPNGELTGPHAEIAVRLARLLLARQPPDYAAADRLLERVFDDRQPAPGAEAEPAAGFEARAALQAQAVQLRVVSLAGQGRAAQAGRLLSDLSATRPEELLRILQAVSTLPTGHELTPDLAGLQLQAAQKLAGQRDRLKPAEQRQLDDCLARALAATGQVPRAIALYEERLKAAPRDRALLTALAQTLMQSGTKEGYEKARARWRQLEALSQPGSANWMSARYQICECLFHLKQSVECRKLIAGTRLLDPDLGGAAQRKKFDDLESRLTTTE